MAIPLIISVPEGFPQGTASPQLTSLIDVMPTLAELAHIPVPADADGCSLVPAMRGKIDPDRAIFSEYYEWDQWPGRMIRFREWKYIYYHGNAELLFDLDRDPQEMQNLVGVPEYADICADLRQQILSGWRIPGLDTDFSGLSRPIQPMPQFVRDALEERGLLATYRRRPPYQQNDYLSWINRAKRSETKEKRLCQMLDELTRGDVYMKMAYKPSETHK